MDKPKPKVVNSSSPSPHMRFDRKNALIGGVILILLIGGAIAWLVIRNNSKKAPVSTQKPSQIVDKALHTSAGVSKQQLLDALQSNPSKDEKQQILQLLADKAQQENNWTEAVGYMEQAYKSGLTDYNLTQNIAMVYSEQLKDKSQALKYFKLALSAVKNKSEHQNNPSKVETFLTNKIKELEDQGVKAAN